MHTKVRQLESHEIGKYIPLSEYNNQEMAEGFEAACEYLAPKVFGECLEEGDYDMLIEFRNGDRAALLLQGFFYPESILDRD